MVGLTQISRSRFGLTRRHRADHPAHPLPVAEILRGSGLAMLQLDDAEVWTYCPMCGTRQNLAQAGLEPASTRDDVSAYRCRLGCTILATTGCASAKSHGNGWRFQIGEFVLTALVPTGLQFATTGLPRALPAPVPEAVESFVVDPVAVVADELPTVTELETTVADLLPNEDELGESTPHPAAGAPAAAQAALAVTPEPDAA